MGWEAAPSDTHLESWGLTQLILRRPVSRVIDMNDYSLWGEQEAIEAKLARRKASENKVPYIDLESYPLQQIINFFQTDYFNSTVDFALALAIYEGYGQIDLYGVNLANCTEYAQQKPGAEFWLGQAMGRGIKVNIYGLSSLMKTHDGKIYGYGMKQGEMPIAF